jgi:hypothetical protein
MARLLACPWLTHAAVAELTLLLLSSLVPHAWAQGTDEPFYSRQTAFLIPFTPDPGERRIQQVLLHVSEDYGKTYQYIATALPTDRSFRFQANHDGWYWFTVQTQDQDRRLYPPNLNLVQPGLKVCVDTVPPVVSLRATPPRDSGVAVEWDARDDNLDVMSLRLDYRPQGSAEWLPLAAPRLASGQHSWNPGGAGSFEVRLTVRDKALNQSEATTTVTPGGYTPGAGSSEGTRGKVSFVKSRTFQLNYTLDTVGPSGVKAVEVWLLREGQNWQKYPTEAPSQGPFSVTVQGEGRYGFTLIPRSGVGLADPEPRTGTPPQIWVEVDETRPTVTLNSVIVGRGADAGKLTVYWNTRDKFLRNRPITISWAKEATGPWTELASGLDNTTMKVFPTEGLPFEFYLKVDAVDEAGNVGSAQTKETVKVDLKIPKIKGIDVMPVEGPRKDP